jgi:hypothetical protein
MVVGYHAALFRRESSTDTFLVIHAGTARRMMRQPTLRRSRRLFRPSTNVKSKNKVRANNCTHLDNQSRFEKNY